MNPNLVKYIVVITVETGLFYHFFAAKNAKKKPGRVFYLKLERVLRYNIFHKHAKFSSINSDNKKIIEF